MASAKAMIRLDDRPADSLLAPGVERVVHHHALLQHLVVVLEIARQPERDRREAGGLRREIEPRRVGAAHDDREVRERRIAQAVVLEKGIEAAELAVVREVHVGNVVRQCVPFSRRLEHFLGRHVVELGFPVDEARDEPGTGDPVDLRALARHPARRAVPRLRIERAFRRLPSLEAAFQIARRDTGFAQGRCDALADLMSVNAVNHYRIGAWQGLGPCVRLPRLATKRAGNHRIGFHKGRPAADVDDDGRIPSGELRAKLGCGNG
jgi:hypothetical protein